MRNGKQIVFDYVQVVHIVQHFCLTAARTMYHTVYIVTATLKNSFYNGCVGTVGESTSFPYVIPVDRGYRSVSGYRCR